MDPKTLKPGDPHYMAYVGPPMQYDIMGATQFRLLCTLGLRASHTLLDVGCGSLRAGRLFIPYLDKGHYFGIEPNHWLIEDAIKQELGQDILTVKAPRFDNTSEFKSQVFETSFDYIIAQSVFSHAGPDLIQTALTNFSESITNDGYLLATFIESDTDFSDSGWVYPECVAYRPATIKQFAEDAGFFSCPLPWFHPRQTWHLLCKNPARLPDDTQLSALKGAILNDPEFAASCPPPEEPAQSFWARLTKRLGL